jgi:hypothetical protein
MLRRGYFFSWAKFTGDWCAMIAAWQRRGIEAAVVVGAVVLYLRVLVGILVEYWWYFPADFENSTFLAGKRFVFEGGYAVAFYAHVISGPVVSGLALFLLLSGGRPGLLGVHRAAGQILAGLVLLVLVPSGLVMAREAYTGRVAAVGFGALAVATAIYMAATVYFARRGDFYWHRRFALGTFVLLASPLVLRLASGVAIVTGTESEVFYQVNSWLSWLVPLVVCEGWCVWMSGVGIRLKAKAGMRSRLKPAGIGDWAGSTTS